ncbi:hypothetical protein [Streptomyces cacaoi]|uniref:hypothetical protein n=1 Tax=Streptomyces cacaoi TaxID=1898 RepID=UPI0011F0B514|nr:hypothetical protein [Streptomyces cacaoi]
MPRTGSRKPVEAPTPEAKEYAQALRGVADKSGEARRVLADEIGVSEAYFSKLLSGKAFGRLDNALLLREVVAKKQGAAGLISESELRKLYVSADQSWSEYRHRKRQEQKLARLNGNPAPSGAGEGGPGGEGKIGCSCLPVPAQGGDRQAQLPDGPGDSTAEQLLSDLLAENHRGSHEDLSLLQSGIQVFSPSEVAELAVRLAHSPRQQLADDFLQMYGRERTAVHVIHTAQDLISSYESPGLAGMLLTSALNATERRGTA